VLAYEVALSDFMLSIYDLHNIGFTNLFVVHWSAWISHDDMMLYCPYMNVIPSLHSPDNTVNF